MGSVHCFFCGGKNCKYEDYSLWLNQKNNHIAIQGLYSNWITDDIVATARPSSRVIEEFHIVEQFKKFNINAIINLQLPGEHASCGDGLNGRFSYKPEEFMNAGIHFYNFGWEDMGVPTLEFALNSVQVMSFMITQQKKKVIVHCHAGLGRTGLIIACYLVYTGMAPEAAIKQVRLKRHGSVQNRAQEQFVYNFNSYIKELRVVFAFPKINQKFTLEKSLRRQRRYLHGNEHYELKYTPKLLDQIRKRLLALQQEKNQLRKSLHTAVAEDLSSALNSPHHESNSIGEARQKSSVNADHWGVIQQETDYWIMIVLALDWIQHLKEPVITQALVNQISEGMQVNPSSRDMTAVLQSLPKSVAFTLHCLGEILKTLPESFPTTELCMSFAEYLLGYDRRKTNNTTQSIVKKQEQLELIATLLEGENSVSALQTPNSARSWTCSVQTPTNDNNNANEVPIESVNPLMQSLRLAQLNSAASSDPGQPSPKPNVENLKRLGVLNGPGRSMSFGENVVDNDSNL